VPQPVRRSHLVQHVSAYSLFVMAMLIVGVGVNAAVERHLRDDVRATDQALAWDIARETSHKVTVERQDAHTIILFSLQLATPHGNPVPTVASVPSLRAGGEKGCS